MPTAACSGDLVIERQSAQLRDSILAASAPAQRRSQTDCKCFPSLLLAQVARASDLGRNDRIAMAKTHLGGILHPGILPSWQSACRLSDLKSQTNCSLFGLCGLLITTC